MNEPEIIITGTYGAEKNMACEDWPANADHMAATMVDAGAEIHRLQRLVVELEGAIQSWRDRSDRLAAEVVEYATALKKESAVAAEQRKRAEEAEADALGSRREAACLQRQVNDLKGDLGKVCEANAKHAAAIDKARQEERGRCLAWVGWFAGSGRLEIRERFRQLRQHIVDGKEF